MKQPSRGDNVIRFIEAFCLVPEGAQVGQPISLAPFQKKFIKSVYDNKHGTRRAYLSIARKNGKTSLIAGIVLAHLVGPEAKQNSQIVSGAMSRDQAALVFNLAAKMVQLSPQLSGIVRIVPSSKRLIGLPMNVEYRALAADGTTAHGLSPILAILDEMGQVRGPQSDFVDAITTAQGAHESPLLLVISTQAANDADLLSQWLDDAEKSKDPRIVSHVYAAKPGAGVLDEEAWKAANPALGLFRSLEDLREQAKQAARMPSSENTFRNLILNQRVSTASPFVSANVWADNAGELDLTQAEELYGGLDLSSHKDLTAFVLVGKVGERWGAKCWFWTPEAGLADREKKDRAPYLQWVREGHLRTTPRATVDYGYVAEELSEILQDYPNVARIGFDRWRIDLFRKELERINLDIPLVEFGQGFKDMSPAIDKVESLLLNNEFAHGDNPVMTFCAANAVITKDPAGNRKFDKHKATGRIDGMLATTMAIGVSISESDEEEKPSDNPAIFLI